MSSRESHLLQPLTEITPDKVTLKWKDVEQILFEYIKRIFARNTFLEYIDSNEQFDIYMDANDYQIGAVIIQDDIPFAFYIRKLTWPQTGIHEPKISYLAS